MKCDATAVTHTHTAPYTRPMTNKDTRAGTEKEGRGQEGRRAAETEDRERQPGSGTESAVG